MKTVYLGKPFPDPRCIVSYDCVVPRISQNAFDILITLNGLTDNERYAITEGPFEISIFSVADIPHIILRFVDGNIFDFAINVHLIRSVPLANWFKNEDNGVGIYLLEPNTGNVLCVRFFDFTLMPILRNLLSNQLNYLPEEIPNLIELGQQLYSPRDMRMNAQYTDTVPAVSFNL